MLNAIQNEALAALYSAAKQSGQGIAVDKKGRVLIGADSSSGGLSPSGVADYMSAAYPDTETEVFTFKVGGASGTVIATVTTVYTDATKSAISSITRTPALA